MRIASPRSFLSSLVLGVALSGALAACAKQPVNTAPSPGRAPASRPSGNGGNSVGSATSRGALEGFLAAVKAQDLQAMSVLWGNQRGPARDQFARDELEKRLVVMQCLMQHDRWSLTEPTPRLQTGGVQAWKVSLTHKRSTARTTIETVQGPDARWYLTAVPDISALSSNCQ